MSTYTTAADWAAHPQDLKAAADDIAAYGSSSTFYSQFQTFMANDATFPWQLQNVDTYTSVAEDKVMNCRLVDIYREDAAGSRMGLVFMAKKAMPKAGVINTTSSIAGGYPSMSIRTDLNSGIFWGMLQSGLQNIVREVAITSLGSSKSQVISTNKLWLPSWYELASSDSNANYQTGDGPQFSYYASIGTTNSAVQSALADMCYTNSGNRPFDLSSTMTWTRSVYSGSLARFVYISSTGNRNCSDPNWAFAITPCFAIGSDRRNHKLDATGTTYLWGKVQGELPPLASDNAHIAASSYIITRTQEQMDTIIANQSWVADVLYATYED